MPVPAVMASLVPNGVGVFVETLAGNSVSDRDGNFLLYLRHLPAKSDGVGLSADSHFPYFQPIAWHAGQPLLREAPVPGEAGSSLRRASRPGLAAARTRRG